jgi:hypothetical protein
MRRVDPGVGPAADASPSGHRGVRGGRVADRALALGVGPAGAVGEQLAVVADT